MNYEFAIHVEDTHEGFATGFLRTAGASVSRVSGSGIVSLRATFTGADRDKVSMTRTLLLVALQALKAKYSVSAVSEA